MIVVMLAAGKGNRLGDGPKAFVEIGGRSLIEMTARVLEGVDGVDRMVAVLPEKEVDRAKGLLVRPWDVIPGGPDRMDSLERAVQYLDGVNEGEVVLVHDGARPFAGSDLCMRVKDDFLRGDADLVAPGLAPVDAVKFMGSGKDSVVASIAKDRVRMVQTPQVTRLKCLRDGIAVARRTGRMAVDEAQLVEWLGGRIRLVAGKQENFKITTPFDLEVARWMAQGT